MCLLAGIHVVELLPQESVPPVNRMLPKHYQSIEISACFTIKLLLEVRHPALSSLYFQQQLNHLNATYHWEINEH